MTVSLWFIRLWTYNISYSLHVVDFCCIWWLLEKRTCDHSSILSIWSKKKMKWGNVGHSTTNFEFAVCSAEKPFFRKKAGFGTKSQSFQALIWPWDLSAGAMSANDYTSLFDKLFLIFGISTWQNHLSIFLFPPKNLILIRKRLLTDVFLFVLSQFRLSHFRPLGAIYSLVGFCVC